MTSKNYIKYFIIFISVCAGLILSSCSFNNVKKGRANNYKVFPSPPDTARIQYLTSFSNSIDVTGGRSGFMKYIAGEEENLPITKPYGITSSKDKIYICDTMLGGLEIIDLKNNTFEYFIPKGKGQLKKPINCFVDSKNYLYVADSERKQVVKFDAKGNFINAYGDPNTIKPTDVFVYEDKIYVSDVKNHLIKVFSNTHSNPTKEFPKTLKQTPEYLYSPVNIFVQNDKIYVSDIGDAKIKIYDLNGKYLNFVGDYGKEVGHFVRPKGIAVDKSENLFVTDAGFENVQMFNQDGQLLMFFGGKYHEPGDMWLPAKIALDYENLGYFRKYVNKDFDLKYLIYVTNQYGPDKVSVYGFVEPKTFN